MAKIIYFNSRDELLRVDVERVAYFESNGNYTTLVTVNKLKVAVAMSLSQMEKWLAERLDDGASLFVRIGKRFIVNMNFVFRVNIPKQQLLVTNQSSFAFLLPVSKDALRKLKELMLNTRI